jgi:hypothetical protein
VSDRPDRLDHPARRSRARAARALARGRAGRRLPARPLAALATAVLLGAACSGGSSGEPTSTDEATLDPAAAVANTNTTGPPTTLAVITGQQVDVLTLKVGDCFNTYRFLQNGNPVELTTRLGCNEPHDHELIHRADHPADGTAPYPGKEVLTQFATKECYERFQPYVGAAYELSTLDLAFILPPQTNWERNRFRGVLCYVTPRLKSDRLNATVRASGR